MIQQKKRKKFLSKNGGLSNKSIKGCLQNWVQDSFDPIKDLNFCGFFAVIKNTPHPRIIPL